MGQLGGHCIVNFLLMMHCLFSIKAQKKMVLYIKILPKLLQVYDDWIWCLLKLLKCRMIALSLCCQELCFCYVGYKDVGE